MPKRVTKSESPGNAPQASTREAYWRSLDELAGDEKFRRWVEQEFPEGASELESPVSRRGFLTVMGASMALAGLTGCRKPVEKIVPYVDAPESRIVGHPERYATAMTIGGAVTGLLVTSNDGRPTKIEGNAKHPSSGGGTHLWHQAAVLNLYDPDRSTWCLEKGARREWTDFVEFWRNHAGQYAENGGEGLAVLSEESPSPSMERLKAAFEKRYPKAQWVVWEPVSDENRRKGLRGATGQSLQPKYHFDKAERILSLDSDFLGTETDMVASARDFIKGRDVQGDADLDAEYQAFLEARGIEHDDRVYRGFLRDRGVDPASVGRMNRLYVVESGQSITGGMADHRLALKASRVGAFAAALALKLRARGVDVPGVEALTGREYGGFDEAWLNALADDLAAHGNAALVVAGRHQSPAVHALAYAINQALGGLNLKLTADQWQSGALQSDTDALVTLARGMAAGSIKTLIMIGGNPAYNAPADLDFAGALKRVPTTVHLGEHVDETGKGCTWHLNRAHMLESWGDARYHGDHYAIVQPLIRPLYGAKTDLELAQLLASGEDVRGYEIVRSTWFEHGPLSYEADPQRAWKRALRDGVHVAKPVPGLNIERIGALPVDRRRLQRFLREDPIPTPGGEGLEVVFTLSSSFYDGRWANNAWLMELPDPITKTAWDNVARISPRTARELGVESMDFVRVSLGGGSVELPAYVVPGQADGVVMLELGYGRQVGRVAGGVGADVYPLRSVKHGLDVAGGATLEKAGAHRTVANTQDHGSLEGRAIIREGTHKLFVQDPAFAKHMVHVPDLQSLWVDWEWDEGYQWGMAIDLNRCIGCNSCVIACQSENNVPVVGREQVSKGREMHWLRMDRYWVGEVESARMVNQPMACQHCEMAPCEQVCPVNATVHDSEGLNMMTYNRCIGTRYCSNNCPYKVRRFNFHNFTNDYPETVKMAMNPEVTVRTRGVMEKCSYCLQRITRAKYEAKKEGRELRDGELQTACQQACPTNAIVFGNINDPESRVAKLRQDPRAYGVLEQFNTRPRTRYLARLHNPNPALGDPAWNVEPHSGGHGAHGDGGEYEGKGGHG